MTAFIKYVFFCSCLSTGLFANERYNVTDFDLPRHYRTLEHHHQHTTKNYTRLMIIGGKNKKGFLSDVELIDPFNATSQCTKPKEFPEQRYYMVADFVNGAPTICGGYSNNTFANETMEEVCYRLNNKTNGWEFKNSPSLHYPRAYGAGTMINGSWWITGGYHWYYPSFTSSDILRSGNGSNFMPSASLPERMMDHCMATINSSHAFMAGGSYGSGHQGKLYYVKEGFKVINGLINHSNFV